MKEIFEAIIAKHWINMPEGPTETICVCGTKSYSHKHVLWYISVREKVMSDGYKTIMTLTDPNEAVEAEYDLHLLMDQKHQELFPLFSSVIEC